MIMTMAKTEMVIKIRQMHPEHITGIISKVMNIVIKSKLLKTLSKHKPLHLSTLVRSVRNLKLLYIGHIQQHGKTITAMAIGLKMLLTYIALKMNRVTSTCGKQELEST